MRGRCASTLDTRWGRHMRRLFCMLVAISVLPLVACDRPPHGSAASVRRADARFSEVASTRETSSGVELGVRVISRRVEKGTQFRVTTSVAGSSAQPVILETPNGLDAHVLMRSTESSRVVFDSRETNDDAVGSNRGFRPPSSESLEEGSGGTSTYEFTVSRPGQYELEGRTFGPVVEIEPIILTVD